MEEILAQIVEKISSYNIVNNLYPGILFVYVLKIMFGTNLLSNNWFENLIVFYFVGMVLSRIGSIVIEPVMKKIKIIKYAPYQDYVKASSIDPLVGTLSETNNTYRTLCAGFLLILIIKGIKELVNYFNLQTGIMYTIVIIFGFILYLLSFKKQTGIIVKRVDKVKSEENKTEN